LISYSFIQKVKLSETHKTDHSSATSERWDSPCCLSLTLLDCPYFSEVWRHLCFRSSVKKHDCDEWAPDFTHRSVLVCS
jgi:hypothetical protein